MSAWASDDLASVIIRPDLEFAGWGQGVIEAWNPETFENTIQYRGSQHENLAVASGVEALTYQPGDVVMLSRWQPTGGGATTLRIGAGGRVIVPGTGAAERAVAFMRTTLAAQISLAVFADRIRTASVDTLDDLSDTDGEWVDLPTPGPTISGVQIGQTGRALVTIGADIQLRTDSVNTTLAAGYMSFEVSGATNQPPAFEGRSYYRNFRMVGAGQASVNTGGGTDRTVVVTGLNPGEHVFTAKYAALTIPTSPPLGAVLFVDRVMTVIPF